MTLPPRTPTIHDVNRFIGLVAAGCSAGDWETVRAAFAPFSDDVAAALAEQVSIFLSRNAPGDVSDQAASRLPTAGRREAGRKLAERIDAQALAMLPAKVKAELCREAFRILATGAGSVELVDLMNEANKAQPLPMDKAALEDLIVWVAQRFMQKRRHAG